MDNDHLHVPLDNDELNHLDQLYRSLAHPNAIVNLAALDGFITALASGPGVDDFPLVLDTLFEGFPAALGEDERLTTQELLLRHSVSTENTLAQSPEQFELLINEDQHDDEAQIGDWCAGYLLAISINANNWRSLLDESDLLLPIELYSSPELNDEIEAFEEGEDLDRRALVRSVAVMVFLHFSEEQAAQAGLPPHPHLIAANEPYLNDQRSVGRNDLCPCGSGKKFKKCCLVKDIPQPTVSAISQKPESKDSQNKSVSQSVRDAVTAAFKDDVPASLSDAQLIAERTMAEFNQTAVDDFHGLTPAEMEKLLNHPFEAREFVDIALTLPKISAVPLLLLWQLLADAIADTGLKATAKGNLPRAFCQHAHQSLLNLDDQLEDGWLLKFKVNKEADLPLLERVRMMAQAMTLIKLRKGQFTLTKAGIALQQAEPGVVYYEWFRAYALEFSWGFDDAYPEFYTIQYGFMFTLYLLSKYGAEYRPVEFYSEIYLRAFPMLFNELDQAASWSSDEGYIQNAYTLRSIERFGVRMGLVSMRRVSGPGFTKPAECKATPLLRELLKFKRLS